MRTEGDTLRAERRRNEQSLQSTTAHSSTETMWPEFSTTSTTRKTRNLISWPICRKRCIQPTSPRRTVVVPPCRGQTYRKAHRDRGQKHWPPSQIDSPTSHRASPRLVQRIDGSP